MAELANLLALADHLAQRASSAVLPHFRNCQVENKADGTEVTIADRAAEELVRSILALECPSHGETSISFTEQFRSTHQKSGPR